MGKVVWEVDGRGGTVVLNRAEVGNAYDGEVIRGLHGALDGLEATGGLRAVVVRGNGRHFQAGAVATSPSPRRTPCSRSRRRAGA